MTSGPKMPNGVFGLARDNGSIELYEWFVWFFNPPKAVRN